MAYAQIGRLVNLEKLGLGWDLCEHITRAEDFEFDLTLEHGWLAELGGLKELKHFYMATQFWSTMGQAEVEFVDANWPQLERITFGDRNIVTVLTGFLEEPHWR
ncbi:hypothetical protein BGX26_003857 [Mortierella sp. AD094]|nr:hypothetical protein BGX26_003857 [Mortierella sp. AD094]